MIRAMSRVLLLGLLITVGVTFAPPTAFAQFYRWVDETGNAHYAEGLDSVPQRYRSGAVPLGLRNAPPPPSSGNDAVSTASAGEETVIRFTPGQHIIVDARINGSASVKLILDTGAGNTMISPRALVAAGVSLTRGVRAGRTRGIARDAEVEVQRVSVESLEVGDARVARMEVSSYDMDMGGAEGLLGQDWLRNFNVSIDPAAGVVKLNRK